MTDEELIAGLRDGKEGMMIVLTAADRIEALLKREDELLTRLTLADDKVEELTKKRDALVRERDRQYDENVQRIAEQAKAEARAERLEAALRQIAGIDAWDDLEQGYVDKARAALEGGAA